MRKQGQTSMPTPAKSPPGVSRRAVVSTEALVSGVNFLLNEHMLRIPNVCRHRISVGSVPPRIHIPRRRLMHYARRAVPSAAPRHRQHILSVLRQ